MVYDGIILYNSTGCKGCVYYEDMGTRQCNRYTKLHHHPLEQPPPSTRGGEDKGGVETKLSPGLPKYFIFLEVCASIDNNISQRNSIAIILYYII